MQCNSNQALVPACPPLMYVYLVLHGNEVMYVTIESVNIDITTIQKVLFLLFICLCLAVWLCLKMVSENIVLVRLLEIGANDLTVLYV